MDLASILLSGILSSLLGSLGVILTIRYVLPAEKEKLFNEVDSYILALPDRLKEDPAFVNRLVAPFIQAGMNQLGIDKPARPGKNDWKSALLSKGMDLLMGQFGNLGKKTVEEAVSALP